MEKIVFEPNVCNNTSIDTNEYNKIAPGKYTYTNRDADMTAKYGDATNKRFSTLLADNTHDGLSPLCVTSNSVENNMLKETKVLNNADNPNITTELSNVGICIEFTKQDSIPQDFGQKELNLETVPYDIPNNMKNCFIRDCFDGSWVPGLNNIFDQAGASLKSFIDYHNGRNTIRLINPIKIVKDGTVAGGIGQQLARQINSQFLKFTAYFNYDLLWFVYITNVYKNSNVVDDMNAIIEKVKASINTPNASTLLTPNDIFVINTVNINFLWCHLMIYCHKCVDSDEFFKNNDTYRTGYISALNHLTQIRFDSFATTADGYISNPYIYYQVSNATNILKGTHVGWLRYIKEMCTQIYTRYNTEGFGTTIIDRTSTLSGGVEYVTSQTMAATCMSSFLKLIFPGRSKKTGDATKIAAMNEINKLFSLMAVNDYKGYGWAALKFSGDSAHIVFGVIMEAIKKASTAADTVAALGEALNYEIIYAISERPLAARLIAAQKNVYSSFNNVFIENFKGNGSENKGARHAALYIQWDPTSTFISMVKGLADKMKAKSDLLIAAQRDIVKADDFATITNDTVIQKFNDIRKIFDSAATPEAALTPDEAKALITSYNTFIKQDNVKTFLNAYNIKILQKKLEDNEKKIFDASASGGNSLSNLLAYFGGNRGAGHTNWLSVMIAYNKDKKSVAETAIITQFDLMYETINLLVEYYITANKETDTDYGDFPKLFPGAADINNFKKIFKKIINAHMYTFTLYGGKDEAKIAAFRETREENWRSNSKGKGDTIPGKVGSIISRMETLLTNCFKIYDKNPVDTMKGGGNIQFGGALTEEDKNDIIESGNLLMDALTNAKLNETYVNNDLTAADDAGDAIEKTERQYIRSSIRALEEIYGDSEVALSREDQQPKTNYNMEKILANRLKLIEMDNTISQQEFTDKYNEEKVYLNRAITFVKDKIFNGLNTNDVLKAMKVGDSGKNKFKDSNIKYMLDEIFTHGEFNDSKVIENFNNISDIKNDTDVEHIRPNKFYTEGYTRLFANNKTQVTTQITHFFSNIDVETPKKIEEFLQFIEYISTSNNAVINDADKNLYQIALNRFDIATKISSYGLMEPVFEDLTDGKDETDGDRTSRISIRARVHQFLASLTAKNIDVKYTSSGGRKTRKKRRIQTKRTKKKRYVTKTAHKKKTKNANRSKKNKTRRKRHY